MLSFLVRNKKLSTTKVIDNFFLVDGGGFEPPKAELADLQSAPFGLSGTHPHMSVVICRSGAGNGT